MQSRRKFHGISPLGAQRLNRVFQMGLVLTMIVLQSLLWMTIVSAPYVVEAIGTLGYYLSSLHHLALENWPEL